MKYLNAVKKEVINHKVECYGKELKSYEELSNLEINTTVVILYNCSMRIATISDKYYNCISIYDGVEFIHVYPDSFKHGNFMYEIVNIK